MAEFILILLGAVLIVHLHGEYRGNRAIKYITKPFLIPLIALYVVFNKGYIGNELVLSALFCGFVGDIALMWESKRRFFKVGLIAFLIGHIIYIYLIAQKVDFLSVNKQNAILILILLTSGFVIFLTLRKKLNSLSPLVITYIVTILTLLFLSINTYNNNSFLYKTDLLAGVILFTISDVLLSQSVFNKNIPKAQVLIMATYIPAQLLIILSLIN